NKFYNPCRLKKKSTGLNIGTLELRIIKINILEQEMLDKHIAKGYNFIHLRLIQIRNKYPIMILLGDIRLKRSNDSIIVVMESNLRDGPFFFNCYPNFSMDVRNKYTSNSIKLHIKSRDETLDEKIGPFQIIYKIYYKVTKINYNFKALRSSQKNITIVIEANLRKFSVQVPKKLSH
ncbi:hypothetical protein CR513_20833, partial [Mucuna pruriens]